MIRIAILGSTGSIGRSTLEVVARHPERFQVVGLAANTRVDALAAQVARFDPRSAVVADEHALLPAGGGATAWARGRQAVLDMAGRPDVDVVVNALVGAAGLEPTQVALAAGHRLALANKESLVAGGPLVLRAMGRGGAEIIPIDSEHSAILQCIEGYDRSAVQRITLTASGGPFRGRKLEDLWDVRPSEALLHPTWDMGAKITVDSATLANKALEVIEAHVLFGIGYERIGAVVHPQSVVHSFVEFVDGSVLAQLGFPTMELPILYALSYPERVEDATLRTFDPVRSSPLTFEELDLDAFPLFGLGVEAGNRGGCAPAVYNAGNEIAVQAFLEEKIRFPEMAEIVTHALDGVGHHEVHEVEDVLAADRAARNLAAQAVERLGQDPNSDDCMTILATLIVLAVLIFVHELGHFAAAKAVGVEVQRFSIGLGPKLFGFRRGETEYVISVIPLGGYVKMGGMDDEVMERIEGGAAEALRVPGARDFDAKPIWARTLVISAGVVMNMLFAFGVYTYVAAHWGLPQLETTRIGQVESDLLPPGTEALAQVEPGSHVARIGDSAVEDWGDLQQGLYASAPGPVRIELSNPPLTVEIRIPADEPQRRDLVRAVERWIDAGVGAVNPGSPADRAGLEAGDRIVSVDGVEVRNWHDFVHEVESRPGERVEIAIEREGRGLIRALTLDAESATRADGTVAQVGKIGIWPPSDEYSYRDVSLGQAVVAGAQETVAVTGMILGFLRDLFTGGVSPRSMGSIVTIGEASGQAAAAGVDTFLRFMALFSVNLAILNLLPIPVLDGGHLVFLAIEAIRGKAVSVEQRLRWSNVGVLVVVGIMLWALSNDILRLLGL